MINYETGNLLESKAEALVNTVNTEGVMGKGIALQFKQAFPNNFKEYLRACKDKLLEIGKLLVVEDVSLMGGRKIIVNFPTKTTWRKPSEYDYIEKGLAELVRVVKEKNIKSIAIPPLGAGNGGLEWIKVKQMLEKYLTDVECEVHIYEPSAAIREVSSKERAKLTPARAMLLSVLYDLVRNGEFVSEFSAEKIAYFLQRFGAKEVFNLDFKPYFYGPYSGKVKHVLYYLNGSYVTGYSAKDKKPFEEIWLVADAEEDIIKFLDKDENSEYRKITRKTEDFLSGFYSNFGLELLSTIDFIRNDKKIYSLESITKELENWSDRKKTLFANSKFIKIAVEHLQSNFA